MKSDFPRICAPLWATFALALTTLSVHADQLQMQNGDRYTGKVLSVTEDSLVLQSDVLGKVTLPRHKIQSLTFGDASATNAAPSVQTVTSAPVIAANTATTNADLAAALRSLGANTNFVQQVRQQLLAGSPEAGQKYDELVAGLMSGQVNLNDLRNEAKTSIDQMNQLKRELGPEAGDALESYLTILQNFVDETATIPAPTRPVAATTRVAPAAGAPGDLQTPPGR